MRFWFAFGVALALFALVTGINLLLKNCGSAASARKLVRQGNAQALNAALGANPALLAIRDSAQQATLLHLAVDLNQYEIAVNLLRSGADPNARDKYGMTPLHKAAIFNRVNIAGLLIDNNADLNALAPKYGYIFVAPVHLAAEAGAADMIDLLAESGADMNPQPSNAPINPSPLHLAAAKGRYAAVKALLDNCADPAAKDRNGRTPEAWAKEMNQPEVAKLLEHAGHTKAQKPE